MITKNQTNIAIDYSSTNRQDTFAGIIGNLVLFLIIASYFDLFKLMFIPPFIRTVAPVVMPVIMLAFILLKITYSTTAGTKMHFSSFILILIISAIPSIFVAYYFHGQTIILSAWANKILLFYFLYFYVHYFNISIKFILRLLLGIGLFAVLLYYVQFFLYPKLILDIGILEGRGTIRLFVAGMLCTQVAYFYFLNRFFSTKKIIPLVLSLLTLSIFILQGTRQLIFALFFLTLVNFLFAKRIKAKLWIFILFAMAIVALFFIFREIFNELTKVSTSQAKNVSGGIRLKAAEFYLTTFMPDTFAYIFGNSPSAPGTRYYMEIMLYNYKYGFYTSDLGILGDYVKYGIIFTITGILFLVKAIRFRISPEYAYLKYYIYSQCFTLITGYGILGGVDIVLLLILYIFDVDRANKIKSTNDLREQETINQNNLLPT